METIVLSDMHLADVEPPDPKRPYWKAFKRKEHFFDRDFAHLLAHLDAQTDGALELVLNGDVFDFDAIMQLPRVPPEPLQWIERLRGLSSESWKSVYKLERILECHGEWFDALAAFLERGHRAIFVVGNHDLELHWPSVQKRIRQALGVTEQDPRVTFCDWFYLSDGDAFITHGHQYDPYCATNSAIDPLVLNGRGEPRVRIPFGDMAQRYMLNGMGYFNPHASANYIMTTRQYVTFYLKHMLRSQPLLLWTWFWSAMVTLCASLREFWRPRVRDPLMVDEKIRAVAERANASPSMVRRLQALDVPSACTDPVKVARELWLDRGLLVLLMLFAAYQVVATTNLLFPVSPLWALVPLGLAFPFFLIYSFKVKPQVFEEPMLNEERARLIHRITGARIAVLGHNHKPALATVGPMIYANSGFWSPAFKEPECKNRIGTQTYIRLPERRAGQQHRQAELWEWPPRGEAPRLLESHAAQSERVTETGSLGK